MRTAFRITAGTAVLALLLAACGSKVSRPPTPTEIGSANFADFQPVALRVPTAQAGEDVGEIMAVTEGATVSGLVGERPLVVGSKVSVGDVVATDAGGEAQLLFSDGTRMVVGPNSSLVIDEYLFGGNATANATENRFAVVAQGGAFRFISGDSGDRGYSIRTPSAKISVRGTAFDFTAMDGTWLVLLDGEAKLCGEGGDCATIRTRCQLLHAEPGQDVEEITLENGRVQQTRDHFPYLTSQSSLLEGFRIADHGCTDDPGGLAEFVMDAQMIRKVVPRVLGAAGVIGAVAVLLLSGGGAGASVSTNNSTN